MKKLVVLCLLVMSMGAFAAPQWENTATGIKALENLSITFSFVNINYFSVNPLGGAAEWDINSISYTVSDADGNTRSGVVNADALNGGTFTFADLNAGETISFAANASLDSVDTDFSTVGNIILPSEGDISSFTAMMHGGSTDFLSVAYNASFSSDSIPNGQPLPGALAVLALGGAIQGYRMRKRSKK